jgi:hypothetical protein
MSGKSRVGNANALNEPLAELPASDRLFGKAIAGYQNPGQ